jgi:hypothetical protein
MKEKLIDGIISIATKDYTIIRTNTGNIKGPPCSGKRGEKITCHLRNNKIKKITKNLKNITIKYVEEKWKEN